MAETLIVLIGIAAIVEFFMIVHLYGILDSLKQEVQSLYYVLDTEEFEDFSRMPKLQSVHGRKKESPGTA